MTALRPAIPRLVAAVMQSTDLRLRASLCGAIGNLAGSKDNRAALRKAGAAKALVGCLQTDDPLVQTLASYGVGRLSVEETGVVEQWNAAGRFRVAGTDVTNGAFAPPAATLEVVVAL